MNPPGFQKPSQNYSPQTSQAAQPDQTSDMMKILIQMQKNQEDNMREIKELRTHNKMMETQIAQLASSSTARIDVIDEIIQDELPQVLLNDTLEAVLMLEASEGEGHAEVDSLILELDGKGDQRKSLEGPRFDTSFSRCPVPISTSTPAAQNQLQMGFSSTFYREFLVLTVSSCACSLSCATSPAPPATICSQHMHHRPPLLRSITTTTTTPGINRARGFLPQNHLAFLVLDHLHRRLPPVLHTCIAHLCCVSSTPGDTTLIQPHGLHEYCRNISFLVICIQASSLSAPTMGRSSAPSAPPKKKQKQSSVAPSSAAPSSAAPSSKASTVVSQRYPTVKTTGETQLSRYAKLSKRPVFPNKYVNDYAIGQLEIVAELSHKLEKVGWTDLLIMDEPSYSTLTYEFLSSFTVTSEGSLSFRLANQSHVITKAELDTMFGWQLVE
ncbi:hypothetical protein POM88_002542 [Heracleum sosnowskyi]|uniref:Uncharacterized protein n=1 Tax=Heracleum sosnowskyi TaxID=360622 RepID=A0AAD8JEL0_9APIA|nr:hypothetical protein POM88_002542 [Heracleum sosnowskyi]